MNRPGAYSVLAAEAHHVPAVVKLIAGMIALIAPEEAARAARIQELVKREGMADGGLYESASLLTPLGAIPLPEAFGLLADVPGCEKIVAILRMNETKDEVVNIGIRAVEVDAIDEVAKRIYVKFGFRAMLDDPQLCCVKKIKQPAKQFQQFQLCHFICA